MQLGRIEILLIAMLMSGGAFLIYKKLGSKPPGQCLPVTLAPDVKAYIDNKLAPKPNELVETERLKARIAELESKLDNFREMGRQRADVETKQGTMNKSIEQVSAQQASVLEQFRNAELRRLREGAAGICASLAKLNPENEKSKGGGGGGGGNGGRRRNGGGGGGGGGRGRGGNGAQTPAAQANPAPSQPAVPGVGTNAPAR